MSIFATLASVDDRDFSAIEDEFQRCLKEYLCDEFHADADPSRACEDFEIPDLDSCGIVFNEEQWVAFIKQIEEPPKAHPGLVRLFKMPSVFKLEE